MLHLYKSRSLQILVDEYIQVSSSLSPTLFTKQPVVVPNMMIGRWLQQQRAKKDGISVNLKPVLPAAYTWKLMGEAIEGLPEVSEFSTDIMQFNILNAFEDNDFTRDLPRLDKYLRVCNSSDRMVLAGKVARIFDQYQVYRGDWLSSWEQDKLLDLGEDEPWQKSLWVLLTSKSNEKYRSQLEQDLKEKIKNKTFSLPQSLFIFGVTNLPSGFIDLIKTLSEHCECHVFSFCAQEGDDIPDEVKHWHQTGIDFFSQLDVKSDLDIKSTPVTSQLQLLQNTLTGNSVQAVDVDDKTLIAVNCFSEMREVEALHDYLLHQFANNPELKSGDVLVAITDIEKYAPFIRAVFSHDSGDIDSTKNIPFVISGSLATTESAFITGLTELLNIPDWRFTREQVMVIARNRLIQNQFDFSDESLDQIDSWLDDAGVRWGIDAAHKEELGLPPTSDNTWRSGLDRLLMGAVLPKKLHPDLPLFHNVLPVDEMEGDLTLLMSRFVSFCELLFDLRKVLKQQYSMEKWQLVLQNMVDNFFGIDELEERSHKQLLELLDQLNHQTQQIEFENKLDARSLLVLLNERISKTARAGRFVGMVNFTSMNNLAGIPFKQVCLLGMNYDAWPTQQREPGFDLFQNNSLDARRCGDRNKTNDERYLSLQLILSAQEFLYMSFIGRNIQNGDEMPPSVLVSELLYCCKKNSIIMHEYHHAMHAYSAGNYDSLSVLGSHDEKWLPVAKEVGRGVKSIPLLFADELDNIEPTKHIDVEDLCKFFLNPQNSFLRNQLGVYIRDETNEWDNVEPFNLSNFTDSRIRSIALHQTLVSKPDTSFALSRATGILPHGMHGEILQQIEQDSVDELMADVDDVFLQGTLPMTPVDLIIEEVNITGVLRDLHPEGQLLLMSDKLYEWKKIQIWLKHLVLCCLKPDGVKCRTKIVHLDGTLVFEDVASPEKLLGDWINAYQIGNKSPLAFYSKTSYAYAVTYLKKENNDVAALNCAQKKWDDSFLFPGECSKPANTFLYRDHNPLDTDFEILAQDLLCPLISAESH